MVIMDVKLKEFDMLNMPYKRESTFALLTSRLVESQKEDLLVLGKLIIL